MPSILLIHLAQWSDRGTRVLCWRSLVRVHVWACDFWCMSLQSTQPWWIPVYQGVKVGHVWYYSRHPHDCGDCPDSYQPHSPCGPGWKFDFFVAVFRLIFESRLRQTLAYVEHCSGQRVVSASTKEYAIMRHLYRFSCWCLLQAYIVTNLWSHSELAFVWV